jgi:hypothetical protein
MCSATCRRPYSKSQGNSGGESHGPNYFWVAWFAGVCVHTHIYICVQAFAMVCAHAFQASCKCSLCVAHSRNPSSQLLTLLRIFIIKCVCTYRFFCLLCLSKSVHLYRTCLRTCITLGTIDRHTNMHACRCFSTSYANPVFIHPDMHIRKYWPISKYSQRHEHVYMYLVISWKRPNASLQQTHSQTSRHMPYVCIYIPRIIHIEFSIQRIYIYTYIHTYIYMYCLVTLDFTFFGSWIICT